MITIGFNVIQDKSKRYFFSADLIHQFLLPFSPIDFEILSLPTWKIVNIHMLWENKNTEELNSVLDISTALHI